MNVIRIAIVSMLFVAGLITSGCTRGQSVAAATEATMKVEPPPDPNTFAVDRPEQFPLIEAETRWVHDDIQVNGVVTPDVSRTVPVLSLSGGRVLDVHARLGDQVEKGRLLLRIHSSDLASALADYQKAVADEGLARRALDRAKDLLQHGAMAEKDKEAAEDAEQKALVDVKTTTERIRILGGSVDNQTPILEVHAPVSGTIIEQNVQAAGGVRSLDNSPNLFTIADLSDVWILCDVYENNLAQVRVGDFAEVRMNAYPDRVLKGRVSNISSMLDPNTRAAKVRLELPNPTGTLRPGMFAVAKFVSQSTQSRVVLPQSAILRLHDRDWIFRALGGNQFRREPIQGGDATGDGYQFVLSGVRAGDKVVKSALQFSSTADK